MDDAGLGYVVPFDRRVLTDVHVPTGQWSSAEPGEMVLVEITRWPTATRGPVGPRRRSARPHRRAGRRHADHHPQVRHSRRALRGSRSRRRGASATPVKERDIKGRTDFRGVTTVTIDGEHARDFDDAITIERLPNGNYWLGVHIADVSHYVKEGSALDEEAYERGTSVYFTERAVHMFPAELATGLCSLNPHVDRLVQSCLMEVDRRGNVVRYEMHDGVINSDARMTYTAVNAILTDRDEDTMREYRALVPMFELMRELFDDPERAPPPPRVDRLRPARSRGDPRRSSDEIEDIVATERNVAHRLIEEFMLLANETVAAHLVEHDVPALHRVHEPPDLKKVEDFEAFITHARLQPGGGRPHGQAEALPETDRPHQGHARGAADRGADAADDAEGALRRREPRPLRSGGGALHALHVADPPLSRPRRAPHAARVAADAR